MPYNLELIGSKEIIIEGVESSWAHWVHTQEAENDECCHSVLFLCTQIRIKALSTFRAGLSTSINLIKKSPQRHVQQSASVVTISPITLTSKIHCHSKMNCSGQRALIFGEYHRRESQENIWISRRDSVFKDAVFWVWHCYCTLELPEPVIIWARSI